ncbi:MAG TPA: glycosyltransferase [Chthoniobacterales bacterium]
MADQRIAVAVVSEPGKAGVKRHVVDLLTRIDVEQYRVTYYYSLQRSDKAYAAELDAIGRRGIKCVEIPMAGELKPLEDMKALLLLSFHLVRERPAVLHLHSSKAGGLGRLAAFLLLPRPRVLYTPHAMACYRSRFYLMLERVLGFLTHTLIAVSESEREDFIRWAIPGGRRAQTIPLGVSVPSTTELPGADKATWTVGTCGRISFQKNALFFFEVAINAIRENSDVQFKWIGDFGDDEEAQAVKALLERAGSPPQIQVTGWVQDPETHIESLDTFCMFSRYESFGYVTAEAMLLGIPVVATPATGTVDLVRHEQTGLLVKPDAEAVARAIGRLKREPNLHARLSAQAKTYVAEKFTIGGMVKSLEDLYSSSRGA